MKLLLVPVLISVAFAQVADKANSGYKTPEGREQVARTLIAPDRDANATSTIGSSNSFAAALAALATYFSPNDIPML